MCPNFSYLSRVVKRPLLALPQDGLKGSDNTLTAIQDS